MSRTEAFYRTLLVFLGCSICFSPKEAHSKLTPEQAASSLAKRLKPITDDEWKIIANQKLSEKYSVIKGDSLSEISKRLFGDLKYWPKIWALNNDSITNPHKIQPGTLIAFLPGSGASLPLVSVTPPAPSVPPPTPPQTQTPPSPSDPILSTQNAPIVPSTPGETPPPPPNSPSMDWKILPKQSWEQFKIQGSVDADPVGYNQAVKASIQRATGFDAQAIPSTEKLTILGQIIGSRSEGEYLSINDTVYVRANDSIQVGMTYGITQEPSLLKSSKSDRVGYSYRIYGKVKILGVRDNLFVGKILASNEIFPRGSVLIPLPPKVPQLTPIPGPQPLQGILMVDHSFSTYTTAQHKEVFIDRGLKDGVQPGMIFRAYEYFDPSNSKTITHAEFIIDGDIMITQASDYFSSGLVIRSNGPLLENSAVHLLTDISDLIDNEGFKAQSSPPGLDNKKDDLEDLDKLDRSEVMGKEEKRELKQLEQWKGNPIPDGNTPPAPPSPNESATPPPPAASTSESLPPLPNNATNPPPPASTEVLPPVDLSAPPVGSEDPALPPPPSAE